MLLLCLCNQLKLSKNKSRVTGEFKSFLKLLTINDSILVAFIILTLVFLSNVNSLTIICIILYIKNLDNFRQ